MPAQAVAFAADVTEAPVQPGSFGMRNGFCTDSQPPIGANIIGDQFRASFSPHAVDQRPNLGFW